MYPDGLARRRHPPARSAKLHKGSSDQGDDNNLQTLSFKILAGKRYAHTAADPYWITMASLQPDTKRMPNCACNAMKKNQTVNDKVIVIAEHNLEEHILCVLDQNRLQQCKLNFMIDSGEQIAFRTIGDIPVQLNGVYSSSD